MAYLPKRKGNKRPAYRKRGKAGNKLVRAKLSAPVKNAINKLIHKTQETKYATRYITPTLYNGTITNKNEWMFPFPDIYQVGNASGPHGSVGNSTNRIGDTIQPLSLKVYITVSLADTCEITADIFVNLWVFTMKSAKNIYAVQSDDTPGAGTFLDTGNGTLQSWLGNTTDLGCPVNSREFSVIKAYKFRLAKGAGHLNEGVYDDSTVTGASTTFRHIVCDIPCPTNIKYSDDNDLQPQNFCPLMAIGYCHMDGTTSDSVTQNLRVTYRSNLYFKDS